MPKQNLPAKKAFTELLLLPRVVVLRLLESTKCTNSDKSLIRDTNESNGISLESNNGANFQNNDSFTNALNNSETSNANIGQPTHMMKRLTKALPDLGLESYVTNNDSLSNFIKDPHSKESFSSSKSSTSSIGPATSSVPSFENPLKTSTPTQNNLSPNSSVSSLSWDPMSMESNTSSVPPSQSSIGVQVNPDTNFQSTQTELPKMVSTDQQTESQTFSQPTSAPEYPPQTKSFVLDSPDVSMTEIAEESKKVRGKKRKPPLDSTNDKRKLLPSEKRLQMKFKCPFCVKTFSLEKDKIAHLEMSHSTRPSSLHVCEICGRAFLKLQGLKIHKKRIHPNQTADISRAEDQIFQCEKCGKSFKRMNNLTRHKLKIHSISPPKELSQLTKPKPPLVLADGKKIKKGKSASNVSTFPLWK